MIIKRFENIRTADKKFQGEKRMALNKLIIFFKNKNKKKAFQYKNYTKENKNEHQNK